MITFEDGYICHRVKVTDAKNGCVLCQKKTDNPKLIDRNSMPKDIVEKIEFFILKDLDDNFHICHHCRAGITIRVNAEVRKTQGVKHDDSCEIRMRAYSNRYETERKLYHNDKKLELMASEIIISKIKKLSKRMEQHETNR